MSGSFTLRDNAEGIFSTVSGQEMSQPVERQSVLALFIFQSINLLACSAFRRRYGFDVPALLCSLAFCSAGFATPLTAKSGLTLQLNVPC